MKRTFIIVLISLVSACAFTPQTAEIAPEISYTESTIGSGVTVSVKVVDERAETALGHRGTAYGKGAEITTDVNLPKLFKDEISKGLIASGFNVVDAQSADHVDLRAELRLFEYSTSSGFWSGGIHTKSAIKVIATKGDQQYDQLYRTDSEDRRMFVPSGSANEDYLNALVEATMQEIFADNALLQFMAE